jgi:oligopeptide/dipeptide ABC transporter ATP-binding protein
MPMTNNAPAPLLELRGLRVALPSRAGALQVIWDVELTLNRGATLGVAGESGSGKTLTALTLLGLLPSGAIVEGEARFEGRNILSFDRNEARGLRGREIAMVFQDPMTCLHPMLTIGRQLTEHVRYHFSVSRREAEQRALELLEQVRMPGARLALSAYPHQFSGGMRQRIAIAIALACRPKLLIADEPTTALDVTVQAGILELLTHLRAENDLAIMIITHDLGVISAIADTIAVFYAGRIVESGNAADLILHPRHPYTRALIHALPRAEAGPRHELHPIPGSPAVPGAWPAGCPFNPRCQFVQASCTAMQPLRELDDGRRLACVVDPLR